MLNVAEKIRTTLDLSVVTAGKPVKSVSNKIKFQNTILDKESAITFLWTNGRFQNYVFESERAGAKTLRLEQMFTAPLIKVAKNGKEGSEGTVGRTVSSYRRYELKQKVPMCCCFDRTRIARERI